MGKRQRRRQRKSMVRKLPNESKAAFQSRLFAWLRTLDLRASE